MDQSKIDEDGLVEAGIPPSVAEETEEPDSDDESFSIDDFDDADVQESIKENVSEDLPGNESIVEEPSQKATSPVHPVTNGNGTVAQFRESLSDLSRQLEIDKLTFLHNKMVESGKDIASLSDIASDIQGDSPMFPPTVMFMIVVHLPGSTDGLQDCHLDLIKEPKNFINNALSLES